MFCSKTGHVYEQRLITKHVESAGRCPVTDLEITVDDLFHVKSAKAVRPRPASATSVPGMLSLFQSEWDALMTETFELKTNLDTTRKQLSHALYQHDAACRVIARLLRERDQARAQAKELQDLAGQVPAPDREVEMGLTPEIIQRMSDIAKSLSRTRKQRHFPGLAPVAEMKQLTCTAYHAIHQSTAPGILCIDQKENRIVTGGMDSQVILFDGETQKLAQKLLGHRKKVGSVAFHPRDVVLSASEDGTARVWTSKDSANWKSEYSCVHVVKHKGEVTDLSIHPLGDYFVTSSLDRSWALHDLTSGRCVRHMQEQPSGYGCMKFHPDGLILAGGTENSVAVWDVKDQVIVATLAGHTRRVQALSFSENGYYLATAAEDGTVKLWDLRKPLNIQTLNVSEGPVWSVRFDQTGQYLAVGAEKTHVYNFETKSSLAKTVELADHEQAVTGLCFGTNARTLSTVSLDRHLRMYSIK